MKNSFGLLLALLLTPSAWADELPSLDEKPWLGVYLANQGRGYDFTFGTEGKAQLHLKEGRERDNAFSYFSIAYVLEEKMGEKWVSRKMASDGFTSTHGASDDLEESTVVATYTGDTKVAITHKFEKGEIMVSGEIVEKTTKNPLRFGVTLSVPYIWRKTGDEEPSKRDLRDKIKDAEFRTVRASDGKRLKYEMWDEVKLADADELGGGATEVGIDVKRFGGRKVTLSLGDPESGLLRPVNVGPLYSGIRVHWTVVEDLLGKEDGYLRIEIR
jgi:hypothetical protein